MVGQRFDKVAEFSEGLAAVTMRDRYGYTDRTGKVVIPLRFALTAENEVPGDFSGGLAKVEIAPT